MKKPKVLIDVYYLYVAQTGIKTYITSLCEEIASREETGFEYIISPDFQKVKESDFFRGKTAKWKNIYFQLLYFLRKQLVLPFLSFYHKADLVFSPDILSPLWSRGKKVSVIHDTFFWDNPEHYQSLWLKYYLYFLKNGLKRNGEIITITHYSKERLREIKDFRHIPKRVVYPATGNTLRNENLKNIQPLDFPFFLHVGVMEKRKNLGMLIEAFAELVQQNDFKEFKLVLVGQKGPRETLDDFDHLQSLVQKLNLKEKVVFPGYVSQEELAAYFQHAVAYVFPSLNEGFGLPILEAFSYGLPVIISRQGALMEVADEAALVLEENTKDDLKMKMELLIKNESLRKELAEKGRNRLQEFSTEKFFLSLEDTFKQILNG
ncbi:Glycosyltransferase involved in cell wall bisynthesis [Aquiflexum balticum DSM 16537]|uniref:Glycosyltransferase involved in cell wall bisynthesis n=1 Tax=Aquiflexum balticum DSM 16537 TaxID=758820 RepID=A0A1W2H0I8_9BACT|nr:glycosyltransferase family 1 protein [Aquiflexum balticum]SMD42148.1 Glycosyltransferase involved in cell wall bisynthesis [Aquiflexum balticum DSM 16537]